MERSEKGYDRINSWFQIHWVAASLCCSVDMELAQDLPVSA